MTRDDEFAFEPKPGRINARNARARSNYLREIEQAIAPGLPSVFCDPDQVTQVLTNLLVNAQQARRALDYLVGFNLSPLLWKKVRRGLSAGRVQSPALRMICEREAEIAAFVPQEYWSIDAQGEHSEQHEKGHDKGVGACPGDDGSASGGGTDSHVTPRRHQ